MSPVSFHVLKQAFKLYVWPSPARTAVVWKVPRSYPLKQASRGNDLGRTDGAATTSHPEDARQAARRAVLRRGLGRGPADLQSAIPGTPSRSVRNDSGTPDGLTSGSSPRGCQRIPFPRLKRPFSNFLVSGHLLKIENLQSLVDMGNIHQYLEIALKSEIETNF